MYTDWPAPSMSTWVKACLRYVVQVQGWGTGGERDFFTPSLINANWTMQ